MAGKIISFFSHKGGVGKTTLTYNVGCALANKINPLTGKNNKVLLIDADPQMNLTSSVFGISDRTSYNEKDRSKNLFNEEFTEWKVHLDVYTSIYKLFIQKLDNESNNITLFSKYKEQTDKYLDLLRGDIEIFSLERRLNTVINSQSLMRREFSIIQKTIDELSQNYDFVLVDCSPNSNSILNALMITISKYFVCPVRADFFSLQAIDNLEDIFKSWYGDDLFARMRDSDGLRMNPKFIGLIINDIQRNSQNNDGITATLRGWGDTINESANKFVKPYATDTNRCIITDDFRAAFGSDKTPFEIEFVTSIATNIKSVAEKAGKCVYELIDDDVGKYYRMCDVRRFNLDPSKEVKPKDNSSKEVRRAKNANQYLENHKIFRQKISQIADGFIKLK